MSVVTCLGFGAVGRRRVGEGEVGGGCCERAVRHGGGALDVRRDARKVDLTSACIIVVMMLLCFLGEVAMAMAMAIGG